MPGGLPGLANDAAPANRFALTLDGVEVAQFSELTGIVSEIDVIEYKSVSKDGHFLLKKVPGNRKPPTITLKRGKDIAPELFAWHEAAMMGQVELARKTGAIVLKDFTNKPVATYEFFGAWCSKISITSLKAAANEVVTEEITIVCEEIKRA